ncbi:MAG: hypothetical protein LH606_00835 [Cytophagaceae bacterium]|nr:hypothetical protein [Cytophagaceae bacterium]
MDYDVYPTTRLVALRNWFTGLCPPRRRPRPTNRRTISPLPGGVSPGKVYLHFDRPYYSAGETIWYKAYLFNATTHEADSVSRVLYVELIDGEARKVLKTKQLRAENGYATGDFVLPDSLPAGQYQVRAYTNWTRNFPDDFYFTHDFRVFGPETPSSPPPVSGPIDLQFFPEGGNLLAGF